MKLPQSWKDVTLRQYARLNEIAENDKLDAIEKDILTISELSGLTYRQTLELTLEEKRSALKSIQFINTLDSIPKRPKRYFRIGSKVFKVTLDMRKITGGQYIDLMTFLKDPKDHIKNIHNVLAVIALSLGSKYAGAKHAERAELFYERLDIATVYPIMVFFCAYSEHLTKVMQDYLKKQTLTLTNSIADLEIVIRNNTDGSKP